MNVQAPWWPQTSRCIIKWDGDEWTQTGTLPLRSLGLSDQDVSLVERYRRIK
ncbi:MAG: hypothetical protein JSR15_12975 [Proteobacteria bacterium]|nr:hypothetical protein [Pseudomonadota bacterium]